MTQPKSTDYAATIRAAKEAIAQPSDLLALGNAVHSPHYGTGKVIRILGNRLIVKFPGYSVPVQFKEWEQALQSGEIVPQVTAKMPSQLPKEVAQNSADISLELLQTINQPKFRAIADSYLSPTLPISWQSVRTCCTTNWRRCGDWENGNLGESFSAACAG